MLNSTNITIIRTTKQLTNHTKCNEEIVLNCSSTVSCFDENSNSQSMMRPIDDRQIEISDWCVYGAAPD